MRIASNYLHYRLVCRKKSAVVMGYANMCHKSSRKGKQWVFSSLVLFWSVFVHLPSTIANNISSKMTCKTSRLTNNNNKMADLLFCFVKHLWNYKIKFNETLRKLHCMTINKNTTMYNDLPTTTATKWPTSCFSSKNIFSKKNIWNYWAKFLG